MHHMRRPAWLGIAAFALAGLVATVTHGLRGLLIIAVLKTLATLLVGSVASTVFSRSAGGSEAV
jgi:hypothetical protein